MHRVGLGLSLEEAHAPSVSLVGTCAVVGCLLGYACFKTTRVVFPIESVSFLHTSTTRKITPGSHANMRFFFIFNVVVSDSTLCTEEEENMLKADTLAIARNEVLAWT